MLLAGDIGGTKTVLTLVDVSNGAQRPLREQTFPSQQYPSLEAIIDQFLTKKEAKAIICATFGVAGPVVDSKQARITNLPWIIEAKNISQQFDIPTVYLLNDLEAIANAIPHLSQDDLIELKPGQADTDEAIAVIAPGTGLGEAFLVWNGERYEPHPSEGGHSAFAPINELQLELLTYLQPKLGYVTYELVCSGKGLPNIYDFLRDTNRYPEPDWLAEELAQADDKTPIIVQNAIEKELPICQATLALFMEIMGSEAGNLTLKLMATGGVYVAGGIPPRILPQLQQSNFNEAFTQKPPHTELLQNIPVYVVQNAKSALHGAIHAGVELIKHV